MGGGGAVLAVAGVVQHQHAPVMGGGGQVLAQPPHPPLVDHLVVPGRFRQEPLQPLDLAVLGPSDRLGPGQPGQGLVPIAWQQQALQVVTQAAALGHACQQRVELGGLALQWARRGLAQTTGRHRRSLAPDGEQDHGQDRPSLPQAQQTTASAVFLRCGR
jgi:hypothetical protein